MSKCCPQDHVLDLYTKDCVAKMEGVFNNISLQVERFDQSRRQLVVTQLPYTVPTEMVSRCEVHMRRNIRGFVLTPDETLVVKETTPSEVYTEFCVDNAVDRFGEVANNDVVAQVCDSCHVPCISFCCSRG